MPAAPPLDGELGILARRKVEAGIIAPIYGEMCAQIGEEMAQAILDKAIREAAIGAARSLAAKTPGGTSLRTFQELQHLWTQDDALTIEVLKATDTEFDFNVLRCRYAETYRTMGLGAIGHLLSCNRDAAFCLGYDPRLKLERSQTLQSDSDAGRQPLRLPDFRYRLEEKEGA